MGTLWNKLHWELKGRQRTQRATYKPVNRFAVPGCHELKRHNAPRASQCWALPLLQGRSCFSPDKRHIQQPQIVTCVVVMPRRQMPPEDKSKATVISLLAIRKQKSMLSCSLQHWMYYLQFSLSMFHDFCLDPRKQQLPKPQPINWSFPKLKGQAGSTGHYELIALATELTEENDTTKTVRCKISSPSLASYWGSFNRR